MTDLITPPSMPKPVYKKYWDVQCARLAMGNPSVYERAVGASRIGPTRLASINGYRDFNIWREALVTLGIVQEDRFARYLCAALRRTNPGPMIVGYDFDWLYGRKSPVNYTALMVHMREQLKGIHQAFVGKFLHSNKVFYVHTPYPSDMHTSELGTFRAGEGDEHVSSVEGSGPAGEPVAPGGEADRDTSDRSGAHGVLRQGRHSRCHVESAGPDRQRREARVFDCRVRSQAAQRRRSPRG